MNDEQFEQELQFLSTLASPPLIEQIRARDNAQRKEIAELRAALATQPAAGEPVYQWHDETAWQECHSKREYLHAKDNGIRVRILWTAPPAAAHGDEAVRKDAEAAYVEMTCQPVLIDGAHHYYLSSERMQAFDRLFSVDVSNAAMRAQGDGGEV